MPEPLAQANVVGAPGLAEDFDLAGRGGQEPFEDLNRGRLAGTVGAEEAEALAGLHVQVEAIDGVHRLRPGGVALA